MQETAQHATTGVYICIQPNLGVVGGSTHPAETDGWGFDDTGFDLQQIRQDAGYLDAEARDGNSSARGAHADSGCDDIQNVQLHIQSGCGGAVRCMNSGKNARPVWATSQWNLQVQGINAHLQAQQAQYFGIQGQ
ncbi:hypothetical protein D3C72_1095820 [compost metagenome]